jgi:hypothetical protein
MECTAELRINVLNIDTKLIRKKILYLFNINFVVVSVSLIRAQLDIPSNLDKIT